MISRQADAHDQRAVGYEPQRAGHADANLRRRLQSPSRHTVRLPLRAGDLHEFPPLQSGAPLDDFVAQSLFYARLTPTVAADLDEDGDADVADFATFSACLTGSGGGVPPGCEVADLDCDGDVDTADFSTFSSCFGTFTECTFSPSQQQQRWDETRYVPRDMEAILREICQQRGIPFE